MLELKYSIVWSKGRHKYRPTIRRIVVYVFSVRKSVFLNAESECLLQARYFSQKVFHWEILTVKEPRTIMTGLHEHQEKCHTLHVYGLKISKTTKVANEECVRYFVPVIARNSRLICTSPWYLLTVASSNNRAQFFRRNEWGHWSSALANFRFRPGMTGNEPHRTGFVGFFGP